LNFIFSKLLYIQSDIGKELRNQGMNKVKKRLDNQAVGLIPLLLFMFLNNYFSYLVSFGICIGFFVISIVLFHILRKDKSYQFMLLPAAATLSLFTIFLLFRIEPVLFKHSPVILEVLLVVVLAFIGFFKRTILRRVRDSKNPPYKRAMLRTTLNEFYFLVQLVQNLYTFHLFIILFYTILPDTMKNDGVMHFLYRELGWLIGIFVIIYEQIRLSMMKGRLKKELWLPVLNDKGKVIGCIARSVSRSVPKKYFHPVVRIAVIYNGMLYLVKRNSTDYESSDLLDYPFQGDVLFRHTIDDAVKKTMGKLADNKNLSPRLMIRYTYEDEKVKQLVSLYTICIRSEKIMDKLKTANGKLWTAKQIEENMNSGIFSGYFKEEFPYLQKTILFAENFCCGDQDKPGDIALKSVV